MEEQGDPPRTVWVAARVVGDAFGNTFRLGHPWLMPARSVAIGERITLPASEMRDLVARGLVEIL
jgi:hypothetical protein